MYLRWYSNTFPKPNGDLTLISNMEITSVKKASGLGGDQIPKYDSFKIEYSSPKTFVYKYVTTVTIADVANGG